MVATGGLAFALGGGVVSGGTDICGCRVVGVVCINRMVYQLGWSEHVVAS